MSVITDVVGGNDKHDKYNHDDDLKIFVVAIKTSIAIQ